jgi:hypothetical protein
MPPSTTHKNFHALPRNFSALEIAGALCLTAHFVRQRGQRE